MGYTIYADGELLHSSDTEDASRIALEPKLHLDIEGAGSLSFVLPPGHALHGKIKRLKSIVAVEQDGVELFRGRVIDREGDIFNQLNVACEGEKTFLLDSLYEADVFNGSAHELFRKIINNHNSQVDEYKRFAIGEITVAADQISDDEGLRVETRKFHDTSSVIDERLVGVYGGYLRTRKVGNVRYIDWVKEYGDINTQEIKFAVNLLDLKDKINAEDVFTVLIPLGYSEMGSDGSYTDPVNISSVNNGVKYIQDNDAISLYGKIWRTKTWGQTKDPSKLLEKAREYLKTGIAFQTLTLKAIDMHIIDDDISSIKIGDKVHIVSDPHGVDLVMVCSKITVDLVDPENNEYTFGEKPKTLSEGIARTEMEINNLTGGGGRGSGGGGRSVEESLNLIHRWAKINVDEANAQILLSAGEINKLAGSQSQAEIAIDGLKAQIVLKADLTVVSALTERVSGAEIAIDGANAAIALKANQTTVDKLSGRVSTAESQLTVQAGQISTKVSQDGVISAINQTAESVTIKASKINLSGYVTTSQLNSSISNAFASTINFLSAGTLSATTVNTTYLSSSSFTFNGTLMSKRSIKVNTSSGEKTIYYLGYAG